MLRTFSLENQSILNNDPFFNEPNKIDILKHVKRVVKKDTKNSARLFSLIFVLGFIFLLASFVLIMIPFRSAEHEKNSELIESANRWRSEEKSLNLNSKIITLSIINKNQKNMDLNLVYKEENDENSIFSSTIHIPSAYFFTEIPKNINMDRICLSFGGLNSSDTLICYEIRNFIKQNLDLSLLTNYIECKNSEDCSNKCTENKYKIANDGICNNIELYLKEICLVYDFKKQKNLLTSCFSTNQQKYTLNNFEEGKIKFTLKDVNDPSLLKYKLGDKFEPFEPQMNFFQIYSKLFIIVSAILFGSLGLWGLIAKIKELKNENEIESIQFIEDNEQKS